MIGRVAALAAIWIGTGAGVPAPVPLDPAIAAWAFPGNRPPEPPGGWDAKRPLGLPGVTARFTAAQLHDMQHAVDWEPASHAAMPGVVAHGRLPGVLACGYCHLPGGEGRVENAPLSGLSRDYIVAQLGAFASGARGAALPGWRPSVRMATIAHALTAADADAAARYYSRLRFTSQVKVIEAATVGAPRALAFILLPDGAPEPIGERIVETPDDHARFELRDARVRYTAYVPPGSIARGQALARRLGCAACHGAGLRRQLAGRSPSYMFRQLLAFRQRTRATPQSAAMNAVAAKLTPREMIALAAYAGTLPP